MTNGQLMAFAEASNRVLIFGIILMVSDSLLAQQQNSWPPSSSLPTEPPSSNWPFSTQPESSLQGLYNSNLTAYIKLPYMLTVT